MCIICIEYEMGKLTLEEAKRNLSEMKDELDKDHYIEVETTLEIDEWSLEWEESKN